MSRPKKMPVTAQSPFSEGGVFRLLQAAVAMLLVARWLLPPESAVLGQTLWITQLWFAAVLLWGWDAYRRLDYRLRWGWIDGALWVVILGHGISMGKVLGEGGDERAALNLFWEWVGLGAAFFLLRQTLRDREDNRRLIGVLAAGAVMLAGHGIWQHYFELPQIAKSYERIVQQLEQPGTLSAGEAARLQRELQDMGVPANPVSRSLWENRLRSTEPFATFALANTLGGFLVGWLFVLMDRLWLGWRIISSGQGFRWRALGGLACVVAVGFCLILTKSRTAWVGFAVGLFIWLVMRGAGSRKLSRRWLLAGAGLAVVVMGFFLVAGLSSGFDRQVISEAPKSLEYRLQYWSGAWEVVKDRPWLGTGPGNFRQHYLRYKLPESSEEIADPHNWVLDLWASGGLLALVGFLALLTLTGRFAWRGRSANDPKPNAAAAGVSSWEAGAVLAFFLVLSVRWISGESLAGGVMGLLALWGVAWAVLRNCSEALPLAGVFAGGVALLVHLLGAGGMEMPAVVQMLLVFVVLLAGTDRDQTDETSPAVQSTVWGAIAVSALAVMAFGLCFVTATEPVWKRTLFVQSGDAALTREFNPIAAAKWYERAHEADPYSSAPAERLAELYFQRWRGSSAERDFEEAVRYAKLAIERDPVSNHGYRLMGQWFLQRAESLHAAADAKIAVEYFSQAVARYPNYAPLRAERAKALHLAGDVREAAAEAKHALVLDQINREAGHQDKFLPEDMLATLKEIAGPRE